MAATFLAINSKLFGIAGTRVVVPYLYPSQAPWTVVAGAWESLEFTVARGVFPLLVVGVILLTGITVGRVFCGWACPMGLLQDLLIYVPVKKDANWMGIRDAVKYTKWFAILFSLVMAMVASLRSEGDAVGTFSAAPFEVLSPSGTLFAYLPWMWLWKSNVLISAGLWGWLKFVILLGVLAPSVYIPRFFCRHICPMGASLEPLASLKLLRINRNIAVSKDENNKVLESVCSMGVRVANDSDTFISDSNCIHCGACVAQAPEQFEQAFEM